jgi:hypothetical protein
MAPTPEAIPPPPRSARAALVPTSGPACGEEDWEFRQAAPQAGGLRGVSARRWYALRRPPGELRNVHEAGAPGGSIATRSLYQAGTRPCGLRMNFFAAPLSKSR